MQGSSTSAYSLACSATAGNCIEFTGLSGSGFALVAAAFATTQGSQYFRAQFDGIQIVQLPNLTWTGLQSSVWTANATLGLGNWQDPTGAVADYLDYSAVNFGDSAATTTVDISTADVTPSSVTFSNVATSYTLQSSGGLRHRGHDRAEQVRCGSPHHQQHEQVYGL